MDDKHFEIEDFGMSEAIERLREVGIRFEQPTPYQLKVGPLNYSSLDGADSTRRGAWPEGEGYRLH
jgi:hypothetical protein